MGTNAPRTRLRACLMIKTLLAKSDCKIDLHRGSVHPNRIYVNLSNQPATLPEFYRTELTDAWFKIAETDGWFNGVTDCLAKVITDRIIELTAEVVSVPANDNYEDED